MSLNLQTNNTHIYISANQKVSQLQILDTFKKGNHCPNGSQNEIKARRKTK